MNALAVGAAAPFYLAKLFDPYFEPGSSIINISSSRDRMSMPESETYAATKGAISSLTHALAVSLGPKVRVNSISPGWIETKGRTYSGADVTQHPAGLENRKISQIWLCFWPVMRLVLLLEKTLWSMAVWPIWWSTMMTRAGAIRDKSRIHTGICRSCRLCSRFCPSLFWCWKRIRGLLIVNFSCNDQIRPVILSRKDRYECWCPGTKTWQQWKSSIWTQTIPQRNNQEKWSCTFRPLHSSKNRKTRRISDFSFILRVLFCLATSYFHFYTIVGVQWLNFCVRDGNRCDPLAVVTILRIESAHP